LVDETLIEIKIQLAKKAQQEVENRPVSWTRYESWEIERAHLWKMEFMWKNELCSS